MNVKLVLSILFSDLFILLATVYSSFYFFVFFTSITPFFMIPFFLLFSFFIILIFLILLPALFIRFMLKVRPVKTGVFDYDTSDSEFSYWILRQNFHFIAGFAFNLFPAPLYPVYCKLVCRKFDLACVMGGKLLDPELCSVGKGAVIGNSSCITGHLIQNNKLIIGKVDLEEGCLVGVNSVVMPNTVIRKGGVLGACSLLPKGREVKSKKLYLGVPAREK